MIFTLSVEGTSRGAKSATLKLWQVTKIGPSMEKSDDTIQKVGTLYENSPPGKISQPQDPQA
jgi:hypothetical protein